MRKLTFRENIELKIHLAGCDVCRLYVKQSKKIDEMIQQLFSVQPQDIVLNEEFKQELQEQINEALNKN